MSKRRLPLVYLLVSMAMAKVGLTEDPEKPSGGPDKQPDGGQFNLDTVMSIAFALILIIVIVSIASGFSDSYMNKTDNITQDFQNTTFANSTLTSLADPFGLLVGVVLLIGFAGVILSAVDRGM